MGVIVHVRLCPAEPGWQRGLIPMVAKTHGEKNAKDPTIPFKGKPQSPNFLSLGPTTSRVNFPGSSPDVNT